VRYRPKRKQLAGSWLELVTDPADLGPSVRKRHLRSAEQTPAQPGPNWNLCPRHALMTVIKKAADMLQVHFLVGFAVEFEVMMVTDNANLVPHSGLG
jgi:hypothetical protein